MRILTVFILSYFSIFSESLSKDVYKPKLVNSKSGEHHDFPLGVLEATGRLQDGDREILIMDVGKGGRLNLLAYKLVTVLLKSKIRSPMFFRKRLMPVCLVHRIYWAEVWIKRPDHPNPS